MPEFPVLVALIESGHRTHSRAGGPARVSQDLDLSQKAPRSTGGHVAGRPRALPGAWACGTGQRDKWVDDMLTDYGFRFTYHRLADLLLAKIAALVA
jgi:hypothetical protein